MILDIFTDGACSGNPGPAGIGVVFKQDGITIKEFSKSIGPSTNNLAEYTALVFALEEAIALKAEVVHVRSDSELMCRQVNGKYVVKNEGIKALFDQVKQLKLGFKKFTLTHIRREFNKEADALSRKAVIKAGQDGYPDAAGVGEESPSSTG